MTDERGSSPLALAIREVPGIAIASIGFGCALLAIEGDRLSTIRTVNISGDYHAVASLVSFLLLIMLALAYRKLDAPTHVPAAIVIGAGALMSASMFVVLQQSAWEDNPIVSSIARIVFGLSLIHIYSALSCPHAPRPDRNLYRRWVCAGHRALPIQPRRLR